MSFHENLKYYREKAGYKTAKDFVKEIGIPYNTYVGYEVRGREPKYDTLCKIADLLHVSTDELLGRENNILGNQEDERLKKIISDILSEYDTDKIISFHELPVPIPDELQDKSKLVFDIVFDQNVAAVPKSIFIKYVNKINDFTNVLSKKLIFIYLVAYLSAAKEEMSRRDREDTEYFLEHKNEIRTVGNRLLQGKELEEYIRQLRHDLKLLNYVQKSIFELNRYKEHNYSLVIQDLNSFIRNILKDIPANMKIARESEHMSDEELKDYMQKFEKIFGKYDSKRYEDK